MNDQAHALLEMPRYGYGGLLKIVALLRSPEGCPWDQVQTHESLRVCLLEEAYEVAEAIDCASPEMLKEELGDLVLQAAFHGQIEREAGRFDLDDAIDGVCRKMIRRHPHIFGEEQTELSQVGDLWDRVKREEKQQKSGKDTLKSIPRPLPALARRQKLLSKSCRLGYTEELSKSVLSMKDSLLALDPEERADAVGALLGSFVALAQMLEVNAEEALERDNAAFLRRALEKV